MEIHYSRKAAEDLKKLSQEIQKRIAAKMRFYAKQGNPLKFAKRLENPDEGEFRFRIGDYRIFFDAINDKIFILKICHRSKAY